MKRVNIYDIVSISDTQDILDHFEALSVEDIDRLELADYLIENFDDDMSLDDDLDFTDLSIDEADEYLDHKVNEEDEDEGYLLDASDNGIYFRYFKIED